MEQRLLRQAEHLASAESEGSEDSSWSFDSRGIVVSGSSDDSPWQLGLRLSSYGRQGMLQTVQDGRRRHDAHRSEVQRQGLTEWAGRNGSRSHLGLKLHIPPHQTLGGSRVVSGSGELLVDFEITGSFSGKVKGLGQALDLRHGAVGFHFGELAVIDARGTDLPVRLELLPAEDGGAGDRLRLRIDDRQADYPLTFTATLEQTRKLVQQTAGADEWAGWDVDIHGDIAVVGAPFADVPFLANAGKAYVFQRDLGGADNWGLVKELTASDPKTDANFGNAVAVNGDFIVIGATGFDDFLADFTGRAYLFERHQGGLDNWGELKVLANPNPVGGENFGWSVDLDGDTLVVGASTADLPFLIDTGKAYVFQQDQGGFDNWGLVTELTGDQPVAFDQFGYDVAISGDTLVVGADLDDVGLNPEAGTAYVFERNRGGPNVWGLVTPLTANDGLPFDRFGVSVAIDGDTIAVGAWFDDEVGSDSGSAYVFERDFGGAGTWGRVAKLQASDRAAGDNFGIAVAVSGHTVLVGAHNDDSPGVNAGSAYRFDRDQGGAGTWGEVERFLPDLLTPGDNFGRSLAMESGRVLVGAQLDDDVASNAGAAYVLEAGANADLSLAIVDSPDPVAAGGTLTYTVTVSNAGPDEATGVRVMGYSPAGTGNGMVSGCQVDGPWTTICDLGTVPAGMDASFTLTFEVNNDAVGTIDLDLSVTGAVPDSVQSNNQATESTLVGGGGGGSADLVTLIQDSVDPVEPGSTLAYTVRVLNNGPDMAQDVVSVVQLPPGVTFVSTSGCNNNPGFPSCTLGSVLPGTLGQYTLNVTVNNDATGPLVATATGSSSTDDPLPANNSQQEVTEIGSGTADLLVVMDDTPDPANAGDVLTYTVEVLNNGPDAALGTQVVVELPAELGAPTINGCAAPLAGEWRSTTVQCELGEIAAGTSKMFTLSAPVDANFVGILQAEASVSSNALDPASGNDSTTEATEVQAVGEADLFIIQTDSADPVAAGDALEYLLVVGNRGPATARQVRLNTGVDGQVNNPTTVGCDNGAGGVPQCDLGSIPPGENKLVRVTVQVGSGAMGTLVNRVSAVSANQDPTPAEATETTAVLAIPGQANLLISADDNPDPATAGENLSYVVKVVNLGPQEAQSVSVNVTWPDILTGVTQAAVLTTPTPQRPVPWVIWQPTVWRNSPLAALWRPPPKGRRRSRRW